MGAGWTSFLANLKHYLERHTGQPRAIAHFRHPLVGRERAEVYPRMMKLLGFDTTAVRERDRYSTTARSGDRFEGLVVQAARPINFTATVENWDDAFLMVEIEPGRGRCRPAIWISLYGDARAKAAALQERLKAMLESEFAEQTLTSV